MANFDTPLTQEQARTPPVQPKDAGAEPITSPDLAGSYTDEELLALWRDVKAETLDNGREVRLHLNANTQMPGMIGRGDRIEAKVDKVNNLGHALSIRQLE